MLRKNKTYILLICVCYRCLDIKVSKFKYYYQAKTSFFEDNYEIN